MGQRLVVTIKKNDEDIAAIYYHWSAYSLSTLLEIKQITDYLYDINTEDVREIQLSLIRFVESNGGCIDGGEGSDEFKEIQKIFPNEVFTKDGSRNCGLIAITKEGIEKIQYWAEGSAIINLDEEMIEDDVWWDSYEDDEDEEDEDYKINPESCDEIDINPYEFSFEEIDALISYVNKFDVFKYDGIIFQLIR